MGWRIRLGLLAAGVFLMVCAREQLRSGQFVFNSASYRQPTFAASGVGAGIVVLLLAFLPTRGWIDRHLTARKQRKARRRSQRR